MKTALEVLDRAGDALHLGEVFEAVEARVALTPFDLKIYRNSGDVRWHRLIHHFSTSFASAGFIRKQNGRWSLTPQGRAMLPLPAEELFARAAEGYRNWKASKPVATAAEATALAPPVEMSSGGTAFAVTADAISRPSLAQVVEAAARAEIDRVVGEMPPYEFQDLVATLLRAMGFTIAFASGRGTDGGTDILAYPDPLGTQTPHIRVQVKHRADKARRDEVAALRGILRQGREIGLFVSSGGFTQDAVREAQQGAAHIELMDWDGMLDKWLAYYERMPLKDRSRLSLRPVYLLADE